jgi:hypothetical protein
MKLIEFALKVYPNIEQDIADWLKLNGNDHYFIRYRVGSIAKPITRHDYWNELVIGFYEGDTQLAMMFRLSFNATLLDEPYISW